MGPIYGLVPMCMCVLIMKLSAIAEAYKFKYLMRKTATQANGK